MRGKMTKEIIVYVLGKQINLITKYVVNGVIFLN